MDPGIHSDYLLYVPTTRLILAQKCANHNIQRSCPLHRRRCILACLSGHIISDRFRCHSTAWMVCISITVANEAEELVVRGVQPGFPVREMIL